MSKNYEYKLSVVVIVYNTENYLEECLDSLVNQTLNDIEIICVNDESTDDSLNILKKYSKKYDNISVVTQKNQGGAIAGNNGLKLAKGEYVALVDSDDVVVKDAYEKLYDMAKKSGSDIVSGQPVKFVNGYQREITVDYNIWKNQKTFTLDDSLEIFYDVFYWNKIYKRDLIENHDIYMIPGKIYADVPFVFKSYLYANKISVIRDVVYYWRRRSKKEVLKTNEVLSVSRSLLNVNNMVDRLSTYYYFKDYFLEAGMQKYFNQVIKTYFRRFYLPIEGILKDEAFEKAYLKEIKPILEDIDDIYENDLNLELNIFTYFILNGYLDELKEYLNFFRENRDIIKKDDDFYWNLKYFNNPDYDIPSDLFKIRKVESNFIKIDEITSDSDYIYLTNIQVPNNVKINKIQVSFIPLTKIGVIKQLDTHLFDLNENKVKIPIKELENINSYNVYLKIIYENGYDDLIRIKDVNFVNELDDQVVESKNFIIEFSRAGNLVVRNMFVNKIFDYEFSNKSMKVFPLNNHDINYKMYVQSKSKADRVYFDLDDGEFNLEWKYSLERNFKYHLFIEYSKNSIRLTNSYFKNIHNHTIDSEIGEIVFDENDVFLYLTN